AETNESQRILVFGVLRGAQQIHADHVGIELDRTVEIAHAQHRVQQSHCVFLLTSRLAQKRHAPQVRVMKTPPRQARDALRASRDRAFRQSARNAASDSSRSGEQLRAPPRSPPVLAPHAPTASAGGCRSSDCNCPSAYAPM